MPIALARSAPLEHVGEDRQVVGKMKAPPIPIRPRATISMFGDPACDANAENAPNVTSPIISTFLRPNRSPRAPAVNSRPANTIV